MEEETQQNISEEKADYENKQETGLENESDEGEEFYIENEEEEDNKEVAEENEKYEEEIVVKKRRCQKKKKSKTVCLEDKQDEEYYFTDEFYEVTEEEKEEDEDEEEEDEESDESNEISTGTSILSAISFEWEDQIYEFEELCDPGTIENIYKKYYDEQNLLDETGKNRYLHMCKMLVVTPSLRFLNSLDSPEIDLSYRGIDSKSMRAMCAALETNNFVKKLILKFNRFTKDDCYYLGLVLRTNESITLLDLTGCRIGPDGLETLTAFLSRNESVVELNLSKCCIQDEGVKVLSHILMRNNSIQTLNLSYNNLKAEAAEALGLTFKINKSITELNLCYNNLYDPWGMKEFFRGMCYNSSIKHLNLAWNAMNGVDIGIYIANFMRRSRTIAYLDLSDNRLEGLCVLEIKKGLSRSRSLETLKMGNNPLTLEDLEVILSGAKTCYSLKVLDLENLWVRKSFMKALKKIQSERELDVKIEGIYGNYEIRGPDYAMVILKRAKFEAMKPKKKKKRRDFGHFIWTLGEEPLPEEEFMEKVKKFKAKVNKELYPELIKQFIIPKIRLIDVAAMKQKYLSIFPDSAPPPPPKSKTKDLPETVAEEVITEVGIQAKEERENELEETIKFEAQQTDGIEENEMDPKSEENKIDENL